METTSSVLSRDGSKLSPGSSTRKMKQSRLPFQILSTAAKPVDEPVETRKRKPSTEGLGHVAKAGRISDVKENVTTVALAETGKSTGAASIHISSDENSSSDAPAPSSSVSSRSSKTNKKKPQRKATKKTDLPKILIKLPIGKRKRSSSEKMKPTKKKANRAESLIMTANMNDSIILDDSDLSDDNAVEAADVVTNLVDPTTSQTETPALQPDSEEKLSSETIGSEAVDSPSEDNASSSELEQMSVEKTPSTETSEETKQMDTKLSNESEPSDQPEKEENNSPLTLSKDSEATSSKPASSSFAASDNLALPEPSDKITTVGTSSEVDSSEEDIYMLCTPNSKIVPTEAENQARKLTPKQIARRQEHEKKRALKQQEQQEKRRKLQEERDEKAREKEEQERQRKKEREQKEEQKRKEREEKEEIKRKDREEKEEQKRKEREEKEELKRKEREEKEKKRQAEIEQKNEEKRMKEEERRKKEEQREEERKRKEEEKEAEEKRKQKVSQVFTSFFVKKATNGTGAKASDDENSVESVLGGSTAPGASVTQQRFMPFCIKGDMRLAPVIRRVLNPVQRKTLEKTAAAGGHSTDRAQLYLGLLKSNCHKALKTDRTWNVEDDEERDDIMIVDDTVCHQIEEDPCKMKQTFRTKFFLFEENRRPPYRGTWRKRSTQIKARRPFAQDTKFFDYEVDSDDEWEEEEPGESLHGSDDEKDVDPEEEYEVDNEFFVPHGHLSDEELHAEEEGEMEDNSPEAQKAKLKIMQQEFVAEMKKKTEKIKPRLIGCIWSNVLSGDANEDSHAECSAIIWKMLNERAMLYNPDEPISFTRTSSTVNGNGADHDAAGSSPTNDNEKPGPKKVKITDDAIGDLARLVHGNVNNRKFLVREFSAFWSSSNDSVEFSLESIRNKIKEIAKWGPCHLEGPMMGKLCWTVEEHILKQCGLTEQVLPNTWKYHLEKAKQPKLEKRTNAVQKEDDPETARNPSSKADSNGTKEDSHGSVKVAHSNTAHEVGTIKKFAKVLSNDERMKGLAIVENKLEKQSEPAEPQHEKPNNGKDKDGTLPTPKPKQGRDDSATKQKSKKRVQLLMSVPRGQAINQSTKNSLISQFLSKVNHKPDQSAENGVKAVDTGTGGTIIEID
uniref:Chromatin assembly factor 1 subunit A dimerization domain-containing protein n=1 Tax=Anopheles dirus TaxID=7168 RepID=A0A182NR31_9DIPT